MTGREESYTPPALERHARRTTHQVAIKGIGAVIRAQQLSCREGGRGPPHSHHALREQLHLIIPAREEWEGGAREETEGGEMDGGRKGGKSLRYILEFLSVQHTTSPA